MIKHLINGKDVDSEERFETVSPASGEVLAADLDRCRAVAVAREHPGDAAAWDSRGLEFVYFRGRMLLKISGIYNAAFNGDKLTENERAVRTFQEVVVPILRLVEQQIPADIDCNAIGFEIS